MIDCECNPNAAILVESLRATGYTFSAAIADIIDNSISAQANHIDIISLPSEYPSLSILDDGIGMSDETLREAMRFGSKDPQDERNPDDLGRFGLGLKTAAFSQCRTLTVVSKQNDVILGYCWDLDVIRETQKWTLKKLSNADLENVENIQELKKLEHGTLVLLQNFDRIQTRTERLADSFSNALSEMRMHLQLVFHRFLNDGDISIRINSVELEGYQPFLENHHATQHLPKISVSINNHKVNLVIYTLPHCSKISPKDKELLGENTQDKSGLYIYRNKRLITWGKWFGLKPKNDYQFTRIQVDIPNALDEIWDIDIKKSSATLPDEIKNKIQKHINKFIEPSVRMMKYRGRRETSASSIWACIENRGKYEFSINKENIPQLQILSETLDDSQNELLDSSLKSIATYLPFNTIKTHFNNIDYSSVEDKNKIWESAMELIQMAQKNHVPIKPYLESLSCIEPYCQIKDKIQEEIKKYE